MKFILSVAVLACIATVGFSVPTVVPTTKHVDAHTTKHADPATHAPTTHGPTTHLPTTHAPVTHPPVTHPVTHPTVPVTHAPVTKVPPHVDLKTDPKLTNLSIAVMNIYKEIVQIDKGFEISAALGHTTDLAKLLDVIKQVKIQVDVTDIDIKVEIASDLNTLRTYGRRLSLEMLRLQVEGTGKFLTALGQEIMGSFSGLNKIDHYKSSDTINIALQLLTSKFAVLAKTIQDVDQQIQDAYAKNPAKPTIDAVTKQKVDKDLEEIVRSASTFKSELSKDYYDEIEKIRLEGKELNLWQKYEFETLIDMVNYAVDYTRKFEELFNRINSFLMMF